MLKLIKDTFLIAGALTLIIFLLFLSQTLTSISSEKPSQLISGNAVTETFLSFGLGFLQLTLFLLIIFMVYLIYRALKLPGGYSKIPKPSGIETVPRPNLKIPTPFKPVFKELRKPFVKTTDYMAKLGRDAGSEMHSEFDHIRRLIHGGEHEIAKKRYKRLKR